MPVEEIIKELDANRKVIASALERQKELESALISANDKEWDLLSVEKASRKSGIHYSTIYRLIQAGKIKCIHKAGKKFVSSSELEQLNEK